MSDYLTQLIQRSAGVRPAIRPRLGSRFEPIDLARFNFPITHEQQRQDQARTTMVTTEPPRSQTRPLPSDDFTDTINTPADRGEDARPATGKAPNASATTAPQLRGRPTRSMEAMPVGHPSTQLGRAVHHPFDVAKKLDASDQPQRGDTGANSPAETVPKDPTAGETTPLTPATEDAADRHVNRPRRTLQTPRPRHARARSIANNPEPSAPPPLVRSPSERETAEPPESTCGKQSRVAPPVSQIRRDEVRHRGDMEKHFGGPTEPPTVFVTIGRIEIRADNQTLRQPPATATPVLPQRPPMSLDDYLRKRDGGGDE